MSHRLPPIGTVQRGGFELLQGQGTESSAEDDDAHAHARPCEQDDEDGLDEVLVVEPVQRKCAEPHSSE